MRDQYPNERQSSHSVEIFGVLPPPPPHRDDWSQVFLAAVQTKPDLAINPPSVSLPSSSIFTVILLSIVLAPSLLAEYFMSLTLNQHTACPAGSLFVQVAGSDICVTTVPGRHVGLLTLLGHHQDIYYVLVWYL